MVFTAAFTWSKNLHSHRITLGKSGFPCRTEGRLLTICPCDFFRYIIYIVLLTFVINFFHFFPVFCVSFSPLLRNTFTKFSYKIVLQFYEQKTVTLLHSTPDTLEAVSSNFERICDSMVFCVCDAHFSLTLSTHTIPSFLEPSCTLAHPNFEVFPWAFYILIMYTLKKNIYYIFFSYSRLNVFMNHFL